VIYWYRINWTGKERSNRGFELVEAVTSENAQRQFEDLHPDRRIEKIMLVEDISAYYAKEPGPKT